jgi:hypothetical protein
MMVRNAHEFGFNISAFHHALEAWQVPSLLKENNIGAALFVNFLIDSKIRLIIGATKRRLMERA